MPAEIEKLIELLKELFHTDQADLDFGIYRIINQRREEINSFLENDLLPQVKEAFATFQSADKKAFEAELEEAIEDAKKLEVDPETTPRVKKIRESLESYAVDVDDLESQVYSDLYNFFRRYYDKGDFISQRRYKEGVYAIPYEGEEVKLHWANHDQYYIKTSEYLRDYTFKLPSGNRAHFKLVEADSEKDNRKESDDKKRRFILREDLLEIINGELFLRFEFRPDGDKRTQKKLNATAVETIFALREKSNKTVKSILAELAAPAPTEKDPDRTLLAKHLEDYTRRNTQDYFIHKDLGKFLRRELDFFIKNEIMHLDDIEHESAPKVEQYLSKIRVVRNISHKIIDFLAQIENFNKKLWLKKKFVVETNYCITLDRIPEELYPEIAANDAQREEWVRLYAIDEIEGFSKPISTEILKNNPYLVIDSQFFSDEFKYLLLSNLENLDEEIDGLLIQSENHQALSTMREKYINSINCIHIDPPYNTDTSGFIYKNSYRHSSWLSMMLDRLLIANTYLTDGGIIYCHIDDNEYERLSNLFSWVFDINQGTIVWDKRTPAPGANTIARQHEYIIVYSKGKAKLQYQKENAEKILEKASELIDANEGVNDLSRKTFKEWINKQKEFSGGERAYSLIDNDGRVFQSVHLGASEQRTDEKYFRPLLHPVTEKPCPVPARGWTGDPEFIDELLTNGEIIFGEDESTQPRRKYYLDENIIGELTTVIQSGEKGKAVLDSLGLEFPYSHPESLYTKINWSATRDLGTLLLDFFAGSGTNGHSIIKLNREDGVRRKYILIEMGDYFDTVLKPRIQKVVYSEDWKDGKPVSRKGSSHAFKYIRLESFEDTLNNLELIRTDSQQAALLENKDFQEDFLLHYLLDFESNESLLPLKFFENPFDYKLKIASNIVGEVSPTRVDLVETFNFLIGMHVQSIRNVHGVVMVFGQTRQGEKTLVLWRTLAEMDNENLDTFFSEHVVEAGVEFDTVFVNCGNNLANLRQKNAAWKVRLIEEEFHLRMFESSEA